MFKNHCFLYSFLHVEEPRTPHGALMAIHMRPHGPNGPKCAAAAGQAGERAANRPDRPPSDDHPPDSNLIQISGLF